MPNPTPRPYALNVYVSTPPSGAFQNIAPYIGKQFSPTIRFNANGLTAETTLPLNYTGNLPYAINEWAQLQIRAIDNSEWIFNGYISRLTSTMQGPRRSLTLSCLDGNVKLKRGVGRTVDGGPNGIINTGHTWPAGTQDRTIIQFLLNTYLPDVSGVFVNNIFNLAAPITLGYSTIYDALVELRKAAPTGKKIRFYVGFAQTSGLPWHLNWFDANLLPVSNLVLSDDAYPGANTSNYWSWQRVRDGAPIYNQWTVVGKDPLTGLPVVGSAINTTSQSDLGVILAGISVNNDLATSDECDTEAERILQNRGIARESLTGLETHENLLLTGPQLIRVKADLEPGFTTPTVMPVEGTTLKYVGGRVPVYSVDLGDRFLALGEDDTEGNFGTRPTRDITAPAVPVFLAVPPNPITNQYNSASNDVTLQVGWVANTDPDLLQYKLHRRRYINNNPATPEAWDVGINIAGALTSSPPTNYPPGTLVGHMLYAEDTAHNISGPSTVLNVTTAVDSIPQPTAVAIPAQGPFFTDGVASETWARITANLGGYSSTPYRVHIKCFSGNHILHFIFEDTQAQPWYCTGFRFGGFTYTVRVAIENRYGVLGPYSAVGTTFITPSHAPRGIDRGHIWEDPDFDGNIAGVKAITKGGATTYSIVSTGDFGPKALKATLGSSAEFIIIELAPQSITKGKPLTWAFSVKANRNSPTGVPSGTYAYKIEWLDSSLAVLNTQTVKSTTLPASAQTTFYQLSGQVDAYSGAVAAIVRIEYSNTTGSEDVYFGLISLTDQVQAVNIQSRAVTPRAQDLGIPYAFYNGEMEIPNTAGDLPDEYEVTGPSTGITYSTGSNRSLVVGSVTGTYTIRTPKILMGLYFAQPWVRTRWYQAAHASGVGTVVARCLDSTLGFISNISLLTNGALTYTFQNGFTGVVECAIPTSLLPVNTKYVQLDFTYVTTGNQPLTLDRFKTQEVDIFAAIGYQFRGPAGNLNNTLYSGNNAGRPTYVNQDAYINYESLYLEINKVISATNRRLSQPFHIQMQNYASDHPPFSTGGEKLAVPLEGTNGHDLYLLQWDVSIHVAGGTNNGANYWTAELRSLNNSIGIDSHATVNTSADAPNVWLPVKTVTSFSNNPVARIGRWLQFYLTATGAPSPVDCLVDLIACEIL